MQSLRPGRFAALGTIDPTPGSQVTDYLHTIKQDQELGALYFSRFAFNDPEWIKLSKGDTFPNRLLRVMDPTLLRLLRILVLSPEKEYYGLIKTGPHTSGIMEPLIEGNGYNVDTSQWLDKLSADGSEYWEIHNHPREDHFLTDDDWMGFLRTQNITGTIVVGGSTGVGRMVFKGNWTKRPFEALRSEPNYRILNRLAVEGYLGSKSQTKRDEFDVFTAIRFGCSILNVNLETGRIKNPTYDKVYGGVNPVGFNTFLLARKKN